MGVISETVGLVMIFSVMKKHRLAEEGTGVSDGRNDLSKGTERKLRHLGRSQNSQSCYKPVKRGLDIENM